MNIFSNIKFLSILTATNIKEYFNQRNDISNEALKPIQYIGMVMLLH
ncbi:Uncharacterised protein [Clostridium paraputrificum]|nr:Uncharacterised protein [Clostridium paraputrificum]